MRKIFLSNKFMALVLCVSALFFLVSMFLAFSRWSSESASRASLIDGLRRCAAVTNSDTSLIACTKQTVDAALKTHTTAELMSEITSNTLPKKYFDCHSVAHVVGAETYRRYGNVEQAIAQCTNQCFGGCLHGVMGTAVEDTFGASDPGVDIAHMDVTEIESIGKKYCSNFGLCHGIGHVLYAVLNDFNKASDACAAISSGLSEENCTSGAFMQGVGVVGDALVLATSSLSNAKIPPGDYVYPCDTVPLKYQHSCFLFLTPYQNIAFNSAGIQDHSEQNALQLKACERLSGLSRSYCFEGLGRYASNYILATSTPGIDGGTAEYCEKMYSESDKKSCILGRISVLYGYRNYASVYGMCSALTEKDLRDLCFFATFTYFGVQSSSSEVEACPDPNSHMLCSQAFAAYQKIHTTLPDYRYGLYGEIK